MRFSTAFLHTIARPPSVEWFVKILEDGAVGVAFFRLVQVSPFLPPYVGNGQGRLFGEGRFAVLIHSTYSFRMMMDVVPLSMYVHL